MSEHVYKKIEIVGSSSVSTDEAIKNAIAEASKTIKNMNWFEVVDTRGYLDGGQVSYFQVTIRIGFRVTG